MDEIQTGKLLLTIKEVAWLTSLSRSKIYELVADGGLPTVSIGRSRRVAAEELHRWIASHNEAESHGDTH